MIILTTRISVPFKNSSRIWAKMQNVQNQYDLCTKRPYVLIAEKYRA